MRCFLVLAANAILSGLAGFGVAEVYTTFGYSPLLYVGAGLIGGCLAGAAVCLSAKQASVPSGDSIPIAKLPKVVGLLGTLAACAAVLMAHLSPTELKHAAIGLWIFGLLVQTVALLMAVIERRAALASELPADARRHS